MRQHRVFLAIATVILVTGCTPWATYPPIAGSIDVHQPWLSPIPDVIAQALRFVHHEDGREDEIVFNLPPGTPVRAYDRVIDCLGGGRAMVEPDERAYHVTQVRVRTVESEVDVIRVDARGEPREMTVKVNRNLLTGYYVAGVRHWRYPVEIPPRNYAIRATPAPMETTSAWPEDADVPESLGVDDQSPWQDTFDDQPDDR